MKSQQTSSLCVKIGSMMVGQLRTSLLSCRSSCENKWTSMKNNNLSIDDAMRFDISNIPTRWQLDWYKDLK